VTGGYAASMGCAAAGIHPVFATVSAILIVAAFAWTRRPDDILEVAMPSLLVSYAAYLGIALARAPHITIGAPGQAWFIGPLMNLGSLGDQWPLVLVAGLPWAFMLTAVVAVPVSMLPQRRQPQPEEPLWSFIRNRNALPPDETPHEPLSR
jgi:hypothetical protein